MDGCRVGERAAAEASTRVGLAGGEVARGEGVRGESGQRSHSASHRSSSKMSYRVEAHWPHLMPTGPQRSSVATSRRSHRARSRERSNGSVASTGASRHSSSRQRHNIFVTVRKRPSSSEMVATLRTSCDAGRSGGVSHCASPRRARSSRANPAPPPQQTAAAAAAATRGRRVAKSCRDCGVSERRRHCSGAAVEARHGSVVTRPQRRAAPSSIAALSEAARAGRATRRGAAELLRCRGSPLWRSRDSCNRRASRARV